MPLVEVPLHIPERALPGFVAEFLEEATSRIRDFVEVRQIRVNGFVPSDFDVVFAGLEAVAENDVAPGDVFLEWGSGFGVVAMLASLLEFQAYGIEIDQELTACARMLADDFELPVDFVAGSFIPAGGEALVERLFSGSESWLTTIADTAYDELGLGLSDFDVVYAFPWPGEQQVVSGLFEEYAAVGAVLVTFDQLEGVRCWRKTAQVRSQVR